jgi:hypothetical protein
LREWILTALVYHRGFFKTSPWIGEQVSLGVFKEIKQGEMWRVE